MFIPLKLRQIKTLLAAIACLYFRAPCLLAASPPDIGNFALPPAQQPGPFFAFGQNIINKGDVQLVFAPQYLKARQEHFFQTSQEVIVGLNDSLSLLIDVPRAINFKSGMQQSSGMADSIIQAEYNLFEHDTAYTSSQWTIVGNLSLPSGTLKKDPPTGFGSVSYFVGSTYNIMSPEWFCFVAAGYLKVTPHNAVRLGSEYFYDAGIGRNIKSDTNRYIFFALLELDGDYSQSSQFFDIADSNSGGNVIYLTPSLWFATPHVFIQPGISIPVLQNLKGEQERINYFASLNIGYTF